MTKKKIGGLSQVSAGIHPELVHLTDRISRMYKLRNGKTALYWHLVAVIDDHVQRESFKKLDK